MKITNNETGFLEVIQAKRIIVVFLIQYEKAVTLHHAIVDHLLFVLITWAPPVSR